MTTPANQDTRIQRWECSACGRPWDNHPTVRLVGGGWSTHCVDGRAAMREYVLHGAESDEEQP